MKHPCHISCTLPTVIREIEIKRAEHILRNEDKHNNEDIIWAQTILHSKQIEPLSEEILPF